MNLKYNRKNYKSNLVEFSDGLLTGRLKYIFYYFLFFLIIILYI